MEFSHPSRLDVFFGVVGPQWSGIQEDTKKLDSNTIPLDFSPTSISDWMEISFEETFSKIFRDNGN